MKSRLCLAWKPTLLPALALAWGFSVAAQSNAPVDNEHALLLTGKKRSLIAYAGPGHSFTLEPAHSAKPSDVPGFITIDKQILEKTLEFAPGEWLLSSFIATGMENVPIFIRADNAETEVEKTLDKLA